MIHAFKRERAIMPHNWGPIGKQVYDRTYSRTKLDGSKEEWPETVNRVVAGNTALGDPHRLWISEKKLLQRLIQNFDMIPAGRHLWVSGVPGRQFLFNCHRAGWSTRIADHFGFVFDELMKGGGIGANYSDDYLINQTFARSTRSFDLKILCDDVHPDVAEVHPDEKDRLAFTTHVDDSREGWVSALVDLIDAHQYGIGGRTLQFDLTGIRQRGAEIAGFGGTASGPGPLADMLRSVDEVLRARSGDTLHWLDAMKIDHHISRCVIAGNVRRSARMSIKLWSDPDIIDFIRIKADTGDHWTTNISVEFNEAWFSGGKYTDFGKMVSKEIARSALKNGEPGVFNSAYAKVGETGDVRCTNPCGEIALEEWENCNLGHINIGQIADRDLEPALRAMTRFLIRATFSDIGNPLQQEVVDRNRRIGVGLFGFQEWCIKHGVKYSEAHKSAQLRNELRWMKNVVRSEAKTYSAELGVPEPIKVTTVAPTGTIAKMPGATEGIHPIYAKYFIRRVRYADTDPALNHLDPSVKLESCIYSDATTVAEFVCVDEIFLSVDESKHHLIESVDEIMMSDMLKVQAMVQECWADNAVSFTVNFNPDVHSVDGIENMIFGNLAYLKGTTIMPDGTRPQAPYERLSEAEYDRRKLDDFMYDSAMDECATGACPVR